MGDILIGIALFVGFVIEVLIIKSFTKEPEYIIIYDSRVFGTVHYRNNPLSKTEVDGMVLWMNHLFPSNRYRSELLYAPGLDMKLQFKVLERKDNDR